MTLSYEAAANGPLVPSGACGEAAQLAVVRIAPERGRLLRTALVERAEDEVAAAVAAAVVGAHAGEVGLDILQHVQRAVAGVVARQLFLQRQQQAVAFFEGNAEAIG